MLDLPADRRRARTVELKLREYHEHLLRSVAGRHRRGRGRRGSSPSVTSARSAC